MSESVKLVAHVKFGDNRMPERFWRAVVVTSSGCWSWIGYVGNDLYGRYRIGGAGSKTGMSHRAAYEALVGRIQPDLQIDHLCRNRGCCNPSHLEAVTAKENTHRGMTRASENAKKKTCPRGHEYSGKNNQGQRICHKCSAESQRRYRNSQKQLKEK